MLERAAHGVPGTGIAARADAHRTGAGSGMPLRAGRGPTPVPAAQQAADSLPRVRIVLCPQPPRQRARAARLLERAALVVPGRQPPRRGLPGDVPPRGVSDLAVTSAA
ncbi:hypothetical protein [Streptomyces sp. NPDC001480]|uniref:hypothetical protein n=1 Tax=Streptomyces sp. NPDC001480 TaxID=3364577 RepID=UPI0036941EBF